MKKISFVFLMLYALCVSGTYGQAKLQSADYNVNMAQLTGKFAPLITPPAMKSLAASPRRWDKALRVGFDGTQAALSNWAAGGNSSFSLRAFLDASVNYQKDFITWKNSLSLGYGMIQQRTILFPQKTDDHIDLVSSVGYSIDPYHAITTMFNFRSQFANGFSSTESDREKLSSFMAPGYFILSAGWTYTPSSLFNIFVAPVSGRFTVVRDTFLSNKGAYGVDTGKLVRSQIGFFTRITFDKNKFSLALLKNVSVHSAVELYINYIKQRPGRGGLVFDWENSLDFKVNNYISCSLLIHFRYDQSVIFPANSRQPEGPRLQFKEILGLGIAYSFDGMINKKKVKNKAKNKL